MNFDIIKYQMRLFREPCLMVLMLWFMSWIPACALEVTAEHDTGATPSLFTLDGKRLIGLSRTSVAVWDARTFALIRTFDIGPVPLSQFNWGGAGVSRNFVVSPDSKTLITLEGVYAQPKTPDISGLFGAGRMRLWNISTGRLLFTLHRPGQKSEDDYYTATFSPDGKMVVVNGSMLFDVTTGKFLRDLPYSDYSANVFFSPDGKQLIGGSSGADWWLRWNVATGKLVSKLPKAKLEKGFSSLSRNLQVVGISSDSQWVIVQRRSTKEFVSLSWMAPTSLKRRQELAWSSGEEALSPDAKSYVWAEEDTLALHDARTGEVLRTLTTAFPLGQGDSRFAFSPDGHRLFQFLSHFSTGVLLWNLDTGALERAWITGGNLTHSTSMLQFSPDSQTLLADNGGLPTLWDVSTRTPRQSFVVQDGLRFQSVDFPVLWPDERRLEGVVQQKDPAGKVLDSRPVTWALPVEGSVTAAAKTPDDRLKGGSNMVVSPDSSAMAVATEDGITVYNLHTNQRRQLLSTYAWAMWLSPNGKRLVVWNGGHIVDGSFLEMWNVETGKRLWRENLQSTERANDCYAFSNDGKSLFTVNRIRNLFRDIEGKMRMQDVETGAVTATVTLAMPDFRITALSASPDHRFVVVASTSSGQGVLRFYDASTLQLRFTVDKDKNAWDIERLALSPDGRTLATQTGNGEVAFWRITQ